MEEMVQKTLYFRMGMEINWGRSSEAEIYRYRTIRRRIEWYQVNLSNNDEDCDSDDNFDPKRKRETKKRKREGKQQKQPPPPTPTPIDPIWKTTTTSLPWLNCNPCVTLGSTIYAVMEGSRICSIDAGNLSSQWEVISPIQPKPMLYTQAVGKVISPIQPKPMLYTQAVVLDGKIYLFGAPPFTSNSESNPSDFTVAEVFDPSTNTFEDDTIPPPPLQFSPQKIDGFFAVADTSRQRILVGSFRRGVLLAYYVRDHSWEILDSQFIKGGFINMTRVVLFDNTLYWIWIARGTGGVVAYDLDKKMDMHGPIVYLPDEFYLTYTDTSSYTPLFFHFCGDEFYLLWMDGAEDPQHCLVCCVRLRVSRIKGDKVRAYTISQQTYLCDSTATLMDGVMLDGRIIGHHL